MCMCLRACFPGGSDDPPVMRETQVPSPGRQDPLEKGIATHSSILAWRIPETEELGGLQSMGSQKVRYNRVDRQTDRNISEELENSHSKLHI